MLPRKVKLIYFIAISMHRVIDRLSSTLREIIPISLLYQKSIPLLFKLSIASWSEAYTLLAIPEHQIR